MQLSVIFRNIVFKISSTALRKIDNYSAVTSATLSWVTVSCNFFGLDQFFTNFIHLKRDILFLFSHSSQFIYKTLFCRWSGEDWLNASSCTLRSNKERLIKLTLKLLPITSASQNSLTNNSMFSLIFNPKFAKYLSWFVFNAISFSILFLTSHLNFFYYLKSISSHKESYIRSVSYFR